ncbi:hypothetical protein V1506DRAFT_535333 [Lipomyces tetrasporus]
MVTPNFTGNYRHGRQVNLARSSAASHRSSQSILKDASAARAQREQARKRERAAIAIQSFYRGRKDVAQARDRVREEFVKLAGQDHVDLCPGDIVGMFVFFFGKGDSSGIYRDDSLVPVLERMLGSDERVNEIDPFRARKLARVLLGCVRNAETIQEIRNSCLRLLRIVQTKVPLEDVIESYSSLISGLRDASATARVVENVIIAVESAPDKHSALLDYVKYFLSTPHLFENVADSGVQTRVKELFNFSGDIIPLIGSPIIQSPATATVYKSKSEQDTRLQWLLANILYIWRHQRIRMRPILTVPLMRALSNILRGLSAGVSKRLSKALSTSSGDIEQFVLDNLEVLKERHNIEMAVSPVTSMLSSSSTAANLDDLLAICLYFVSLLRIWPSKNSEIRYFLYLSPEYTLPLFFKTLKSSRLFDTIMFKSSGPTVSSSAASLWAPAAGDEYHDIAIQEWEILSLFLDICWHWMIMTDDDEFFDETQYGLSLFDVRYLGTFLKILVFLIVCNEDTTVIIHRGRQIKIGSGGDNNVALSESGALTLNNIKAKAIGVMRQLFYRDSRRSFLDKKYWLLEDSIDIPAFTTQAVIDEDKMDQYFEQNILDNHDSSESELEESETGVGSSSARRDLRTRMMVTPRIEILQKIPFLLPFEARVEIFERSLDHDRAKNGLDRDYELRWRRHKAEIRRTHMLEDAFNQLNGLRRELKSLIGITFVNDFGVEAGIDGGGITKEFLVGVCKEGFDPATGLFLENSQNMLYPNPAATSSEQLQYFEFLGRIIGKALYQGILVEVSFAQFFLSKWQVQNNTVFGNGFRNTFDDLWSLDPDLYRGLIKLKKYQGDVEADFGLNFTITNSHNQTVELIRGGALVAVTAANRLQYIHEVANYKLNKELYRQTQAFLFGMNDLLSPTWLVMFSPNEMQTLVGGAALPINIEDWKKNTVYGGFYEKDPTVTYFWEVVEELNDEDVRSVLKFVTSVSRAPLQGFASLKPSFTIRESGLAQDRLPTASTCVNMLKLPRYETKEILKSKLLFAVTAGAGFDLS